VADIIIEAGNDAAIHSGRVAVVTGGGRGMGFECARSLARLGANVAIFDIDAAAAAAAIKALEADGLCAQSYGVDVTSEDGVQTAVRRVIETQGAPAILVNAAGILRSTRFLNISFDEWRSVVSVSVDGTFLLCRACLPGMVEHSWGRIVNFSSTAGKTVSTLGGAHYTTAKSGVLGLTRAIAKEFAANGICVNAVCPGLISTEMATGAISANELRTIAAGFPIPRLGSPREVAELVSYLVGPHAGYITGAALDINGGDLMV
jgi:NAD(P)-dependent dehydrogenase (short-subunit alcohol dehydrogenase family)